MISKTKKPLPPRKTPQSIGREKILITILIILIIVILVLLIKGFVVPKLFVSDSLGQAPQPPVYLSVPLPSLQPIKEALDNTKLDELRFYQLTNGAAASQGLETIEELAKKMKVENIGRSNPFIPFLDEKNKK